MAFAGLKKQINKANQVNAHRNRQTWLLYDVFCVRSSCDVAKIDNVPLTFMAERKRSHRRIDTLSFCNPQGTNSKLAVISGCMSWTGREIMWDRHDLVTYINIDIHTSASSTQRLCIVLNMYCIYFSLDNCRGTTTVFYCSLRSSFKRFACT